MFLVVQVFYEGIFFISCINLICSCYLHDMMDNILDSKTCTVPCEGVQKSCVVLLAFVGQRREREGGRGKEDAMSHERSE